MGVTGSGEGRFKRSYVVPVRDNGTLTGPGSVPEPGTAYVFAGGPALLAAEKQRGTGFH